jgi:hypothetical protein
MKEWHKPEVAEQGLNQADRHGRVETAASAAVCICTRGIGDRPWG